MCKNKRTFLLKPGVFIHFSTPNWNWQVNDCQTFLIALISIARNWDWINAMLAIRWYDTRSKRSTCRNPMILSACHWCLRDVCFISPLFVLGSIFSSSLVSTFSQSDKYSASVDARKRSRINITALPSANCARDGFIIFKDKKMFLQFFFPTVRRFRQSKQYIDSNKSKQNLLLVDKMTARDYLRFVVLYIYFSSVTWVSSPSSSLCVLTSFGYNISCLYSILSVFHCLSSDSLLTNENIRFLIRRKLRCCC